MTDNPASRTNVTPGRSDRGRLGAALRTIRLAAGLTTRQVDGFSSPHVSNVENGRVLPSERMIAAYVKLGGNQGRLLSMLDKARRSSAVASRRDGDEAEWLRQLGVATTDPHMLRRAYSIELVEDAHHYGPDGEPLKNVHGAAIRPHVPQARYFPFRHALDEDPRPGVSLLRARSGCRVAHSEEGPTGTIYAVLEFDPQAATDDGAIRFEWELQFDTRAAAASQAISGTKSRLPEAVQSAEFTWPAVPAEIWWFRSFDAREGTMQPPPERLLAEASDWRYAHRFGGLEDEWWGLGWRWA